MITLRGREGRTGDFQTGKKQTWVLSIPVLSPAFNYELTSLRPERNCWCEDSPGYRTLV